MSDKNLKDKYIRADEKPEPREIAQRSSVIRWIDNFWYHYKWTVIVVAFFLAVATVGVVQILTREKYDTTIMYGGTYRMNNEERASFESLLDSLCPEDYDGNGEKNVQYVIYQIYSEDEYNAEKATAEANGQEFVLNQKYNQDEYKNFNSYIMTGECSVCIVSPYLYDMLRTGDRLRKIGDVFGDILPNGTDDNGYGVRLGDTDFYKYNPEVQMLPSDTVVCMLRQNAWGSSKNEDVYNRSLEMFKAILDFKVKE